VVLSAARRISFPDTLRLRFASGNLSHDGADLRKTHPPAKGTRVTIDGGGRWHIPVKEYVAMREGLLAPDRPPAKGLSRINPFPTTNAHRCRLLMTPIRPPASPPTKASQGSGTARKAPPLSPTPG